MIVLGKKSLESAKAPSKEVLPEGVYRGQVTSCETFTDQNGNYTLTLVWNLDEHPSVPLCLKYCIDSPDEARKEKGLYKLQTFCNAIGVQSFSQNGEFVLDETKLMYKRCELEVKVWEFNGFTGNYAQKYTHIPSQPLSDSQALEVLNKDVSPVAPNPTNPDVSAGVSYGKLSIPENRQEVVTETHSGSESMKAFLRDEVPF